MNEVLKATCQISVFIIHKDSRKPTLSMILNDHFIWNSLRTDFYRSFKTYIHSTLRKYDHS